MFQLEHLFIAILSCVFTGLLGLITLYLRNLRGDIRKKVDKTDDDLCNLREKLPLEYVRKEDAIRQEVVINKKLDALAEKIDELRGSYERNRSPES